MNKRSRILAILLLVGMIVSLTAYFITGKYLAVSLVCLIGFVCFGVGRKK